MGGMWKEVGKWVQEMGDIYNSVKNRNKIFKIPHKIQMASIFYVK